VAENWLTTPASEATVRLCNAHAVSPVLERRIARFHAVTDTDSRPGNSRDLLVDSFSYSDYRTQRVKSGTYNHQSGDSFYETSATRWACTVKPEMLE
jgi:hypothetical protein